MLNQILDDLDQFGFALIDDVYSWQLEYVHQLIDKNAAPSAEFRSRRSTKRRCQSSVVTIFYGLMNRYQLPKQHIQALEEVLTRD